MAKLYFRYGTVGSAKTLNLLAVAHNYRFQDKRVVLIKPALDTRFGQEFIRSRAGLEMTADLLVDEHTLIDKAHLKGVHCILVDEAQFLHPKVIDQLRVISIEMNIPVICYGLRSDFRQEVFAGSRRLLELADSIEEVKTTCAYCNKKAIYNLRLQDGKATLDGASIELGVEDKYLPTCASCYYGKHELIPY